MGHEAICEANIQPNLPPAVRIRSAASSDEAPFQITLDDRITEHQSGFIFHRGVEVPLDIPEAIKGYGVLLDRPVLVIKVCLPQEEAWLMFEWDEDCNSAEQVILALGAEDTDSLLATRMRTAAENALTIHRTFFR